jgi:hypothetical protein
MKKSAIFVVEKLTSFGFFLIVAAVIYFILGSVARLVHGDMLDWTFCGSAHHVLGVEWCDIEGSTGEAGINHFIHRLLNVTLPWFMMFWGFALVALCSLALKLLGKDPPRLHDRT